MFGKALKSIKNALNEVKDTVKETMKETVSTVSNPSQNSTFKINGKNYYQEKLLGEGGYGYVFEVSDPQGNRYALKKMNILSNNQYQNILREIKIWKQISKCQNIVQLLDVSETKSEVDILMELCTEGSLLDFINNSEKNISESVALKIIRDIANGLMGMHTQVPPIAHRDVKIENILKFGKTFKLCDFGSASTDTMIPENETKESKRDKFDIFERNTTFMYRPPEMVDEYGTFPVNEKVDIWALGCILYAILFKQQPFQDAQKLTIIKGDYYIPNEARDYSEKIFDFIRLMLTPDPRIRPSAKDVINYIDNWNNINEFPLCQQVLEIKKRQKKIFLEKQNSKKSSNTDVSLEDLEKAKLAIMNKLKKKSKYQRKDQDNLDGIFDEDNEDGSNTKYKNVNFGNNNNNDSNNIFQTKKNNRGRRKQNKNYKNKPKKSWDDKMNIWKSIRVRINKYLFQKLNMLSKQYHFTNFYKFNGKISIKKDVNEKLLNGTIKNYIINSGISGNYNKKRKFDENKNINGLDNSNLIKNVLIHENSLNNNKPFTKFINMKFKKFYFNIFLEDNSNNNLNENNKNLKNFYQYIKDYNEERKKIYIKVAQNIYNIYENMTEKKKNK